MIFLNTLIHTTFLKNHTNLGLKDELIQWKDSLKKMNILRISMITNLLLILIYVEKSSLDILINIFVFYSKDHCYDWLTLC